MIGRVLVVAGFVACSGRGTATPRARPTVQLVRCTPATPAPLATDTNERAAARGSFGGGATARLSVARPMLTFGLATSTGPITRDEITNLAKTRQAEMLGCFTVVARTTAKIAAVYRFTVNPDGSVANPETSGTGIGAPVDTCLRRSLRLLRFPSRATESKVTLPIVWDSTGSFGAPDKDAPAIEPDPWTPFAVDSSVPPTSAVGAARATEAALRSKLGDMDKCFGSPGAMGSLRILLELDASGDLTTVRAGGLGDKDSEWCAAKTLAGMRVMTPTQEHVEVACDLARGDAAPWRLSPTAGYEVIEADAKGLRHGTVTVVPGVTEPEPLPAETYVVVAKPETLGGVLQLALMWARDATAVLLAVGDGKSPPVYIGMGNASTSEEDGEAMRPAIRLGRQTATGCVGRTTHKAALTSSTEVAAMLQKLSERCRTLRCAPTMVVSIDSDATTRDLLELAGAARRAGFDRVLFGGSELGCTADAKKKRDPEFVPEFE